MEWKNLGETAVYENPWFKVNLADVELPNGRHLDHFTIRLRDVALTAAINEHDEVLLLWRHRFITDSWGWELPGGVVDDGETPAEAAAREMFEETGWRAGPLQPLMIVEPASGLIDARHHIYWSEGAEHVGEPADDFESERREWVPLKRVPELIDEHAIPAANTLSALMRLHHLRQL
ncbi:NUDIX hydrolase [Kribbella sp. NPDC056951]|uniref:NUDIX hydrolase n=1 Tax=Kribbella sp. NPDC056951 TaxID=3345978 RepID=UPI00363ABE12